MHEDEDERVASPDRIQEAVRAVSAFEAAAGYGRRRAATWFAGCGRELAELESPVAAAGMAIAWDDECTCGAPDLLYSRLMLAYGVIEWRHAGDYGYIIDRMVECVDDFERAEDIERLGIALQLLHASEAVVLGPGAARSVADRAMPYVARSVACWWTVVAALAHESCPDPDVLDRLKAAMQAHRIGGLSAGHEAAMHGVVLELRRACGGDRVPDHARIIDFVRGIDGCGLLVEEGACVHRPVCWDPVLPWSPLLLTVEADTEAVG
ncbi:hypothetical protein [Demequina iriomotensis]|uniref:hypothetical protein n=1 Tax=Demequina iriomotensis TaxID=1536641 RepID=UPI000782BDD9|nr:hypothetical protein [Demequina iriomotensis]